MSTPFYLRPSQEVAQLSQDLNNYVRANRGNERIEQLIELINSQADFEGLIIQTLSEIAQNIRMEFPRKYFLVPMHTITNQMRAAIKKDKEVVEAIDELIQMVGL